MGSIRIHSKMAIEIRAISMSSINACTIVDPHSLLPIASPVAVSSTTPARGPCAKATNRCVVARIAFGPNLNARMRPSFRNSIADQIDRQALAGYLRSAIKALLNVIKIELQRTNERIPGSHTLSFIRAREAFCMASAKRRAAVGTLLVCNAFERAHLVAALLRSRRRLAGGRGALCEYRRSESFLHFQSTQGFFLIDGDKLSIVQVAATSGNARSLAATASVCSGATSARAVFNGSSLLNLNKDRSAGDD